MPFNPKLYFIQMFTDHPLALLFFYLQLPVRYVRHPHCRVLETTSI